MRKDCSSKEKKTCKEVCAGLKLQCLESIHLYGDDGADGVHKKGVTMKYKYIGKPIGLCENKVTPRPVLQYPFATFQRVHVCFPKIGIRTHIYDSCDNAGECTGSYVSALYVIVEALINFVRLANRHSWSRRLWPQLLLLHYQSVR